MTYTRILVILEVNSIFYHDNICCTFSIRRTYNTRKCKRNVRKNGQVNKTVEFEICSPVSSMFKYDKSLNEIPSELYFYTKEIMNSSIQRLSEWPPWENYTPGG